MILARVWGKITIDFEVPKSASKQARFYFNLNSKDSKFSEGENVFLFKRLKTFLECPGMGKKLCEFVFDNFI